MTTVDFVGIGAQKCATTWLFRQLSRHPQVAFPAGKESHYWDRAPRPDADGWLRVLHTPTRTTDDGRRLAVGEITPAYAILPTESIKAIRLRCPEIRLFISLRNPIERAWSAALMALARSYMAPQEASDQWFLDHFRSSASRSRGDYASCIERWWSEFPREQLLIILTEDIAARPGAVLAGLAAHLAIDEADFLRIPDAELREIVRPALGPAAASLAPEPLRPSLAAPLVDMYAGSIARLACLVDRDLSHWLQSPHATQGTFAGS